MGAAFARWYDFFMYPLEKRKFKNIRSELLQKAAGSVLEIGSGTGINFPYYNHAKTVTAIEPSLEMIERSNKRKKISKSPIEVIQGSAEQLPFPDNSFDTVIATLVLCTVPNSPKALQEMKRVCKPDGKILFFEHVKMDNPFLANLQEGLTPLWKKICDGCCLNRETVQIIKRAGLEIAEEKAYCKGLFVQIEAKKR